MSAPHLNLRVELADAGHGVVRHLRVFAGTAAITQFLPALLAEYAELYPEVQVELEEQVSQQVVAAVREGRFRGMRSPGVREADGRGAAARRHWRSWLPCMAIPRHRPHWPA